MATRIEIGGVPGGGGEADGQLWLRAFYEGRQVPCPVGCGGSSEVVRVSPLSDGAGELWLECVSCAQRARFLAPRASETEERQVAHQVADGYEATCPRHGARVPLGKRGRQWVCGVCGVKYRG